MNPRQFPAREYLHTTRFKPSQTLIKITQEKMREAESSIKKLEQRAITSRSQTERTQITRRIGELKQKHQEYLSELQIERAQSVIRAQHAENQLKMQRSLTSQTSKQQDPLDSGYERPFSASRPQSAGMESQRPISARPSSARPNSTDRQPYQRPISASQQPPWRPSSAKPSPAYLTREKTQITQPRPNSARYSSARPTSACSFTERPASADKYGRPSSARARPRPSSATYETKLGDMSINDLHHEKGSNPFSPRNQTFDTKYGERISDAMRRTVNARCQLLEDNVERRRRYEGTPNRSQLEQSNRIGCSNPGPGRWYDLVKSRREQLRLEESERQLQQNEMEQRVRSAQRKDIEFKQSQRVQERQRARSETRIYDSGSTFSKIGTSDLQQKVSLRQRQQDYATELNKSLRESEAQRKLQRQKDHETWATERGLPSDRYDSNGHLIKHAVPERFYSGIEFSNQAKLGPSRTNLVVKHDQFVQKSQLEAQEEAQQVQHIEERNRLRQEQKDLRAKQRNEMLQKVQEISRENKAQVTAERYGGMRMTTEWDITHGPSYQSKNRRLYPADGRGDTQFEDSCFIDRMTRANEKHVAEHNFNVLPLSEEEARDRALKKYLQKNPQRRTLDSDDMRAVYNYITSQKELNESRKHKVNQMETYGSELLASQKLDQATIDKQMTAVEFDFNSTPQYLKNRFW